MTITISKIEALIEQVGFNVAPAGIDRKKLMQDISLAGTRYRNAKQSGSESTANKHKQWLERTKSITAKLREVLRDEESARWFNIKAPATFSTGEDISYKSLLLSLDGLHEEILKQLSGRPRNVFQLSRSPFEHFAGEWMPKIFSKHFEREIGISRGADNGEPGGPLLRFVKAGTELLNITHNGKPYAKEAIARAIRDTKSRPSRRKSSASGQKS
jgi:hypothetical protein